LTGYSLACCTVLRRCISVYVEKRFPILRNVSERRMAMRYFVIAALIAMTLGMACGQPGQNTPADSTAVVTPTVDSTAVQPDSAVVPAVDSTLVPDSAAVIDSAAVQAAPVTSAING